MAATRGTKRTLEMLVYLRLVEMSQRISDEFSLLQVASQPDEQRMALLVARYQAISAIMEDIEEDESFNLSDLVREFKQRTAPI